MKRISAAITVLALTAMPSLGADMSQRAPGTSPGRKGGTFGVEAPMHQAPSGQAMKSQMMRSPQHLLMTAHHRNVANFGHTLYQAAEQGATVPAQLARVAVAEMRRSIDEMEKFRATAMSAMPVNSDRQKVMDEHLVQVKTHLRQLEDLAKSDRIDSVELKKQLQAMFAACEGAGCDMMPGANRYGRHMRGHRGSYGAMHGCGCQQPMPERAVMMEKMMRKIRSQDEELAGLVQEMKGASRDRKLDLVTEAVTRMVQQRADLTADMEEMQRYMMRRQPAGTMFEMGDEDLEDEDDEEMEDDDLKW